ncbi:MAG: hypothetical protein HC882_01425 [Acidobacteria bacterium]|nr:hypothetical protein [Acidobacteriota bacterium]
MAQHSVIQTLVIDEQLDRAKQLVGSVDGWRRGVALADLGGAMAGAGRIEEAKALVSEAEQVRAVTQGWQNPRIAAHVSMALAKIGEFSIAEKASSQLAESDEQFDGQATLIRASRLASEKKFDEALGAIAKLDGDVNYDVAWTRTNAYAELVKAAKEDLPLRKRAADKAIESARGVPGWARAESMAMIAKILRETGDPARSAEILEEAEQIITEQPDELAVKSVIMSNIANAWALAGNTSRSKQLLLKADKAVGAAMLIERPAAVAMIARAYVSAGSKDEGMTHFDRALTLAANLENSRPRALALVAICRALGSAGISIEGPLKTRLDALYQGLGDPW